MKNLILIPAGTATDEAGNEVENFVEYTPLTGKAGLNFWFVCSERREGKKGRRFGAMISLDQLKVDFKTRTKGPWKDQLDEIELLHSEGYTFDYDGTHPPKEEKKSEPSVPAASGSAKADPEIVALLADKPAALKAYFDALGIK
jgi:hypothetical protein